MGDIEVQPSELKFKFQLNKQLLSALTINNPSDQRVAYKIKTTAPKKYVVRPSSGVVDPRTSVTIQVIMQAQKEYPVDFANCKDKFMIQTTVIKDDENADKEYFSGGRPVKEHRLKVSYDGLVAPPSPVPEANEGEEEPVKPKERETVAPPAISRQPADDSAAISAENRNLKSQIERLTKERDELQKQWNLRSMQAGAAPPASASALAALESKLKLNVIHIVLVAIFAFLLGHFT